MDLRSKLVALADSLFARKNEQIDSHNLCYWKTDIHSHLLPGVDDGVATEDDTLRCLQQFADWGIERVITTPHVSQDWFPNSYDTLIKGRDTLQALVARHELNLTIDIAAEYLLDDRFLELLDSGQLLSFGKERYVLIENGWSAAPYFLETILFRIQTKGYTPILAHPERYTYYFSMPHELEKIREAGCLFQLNWGSLTGRYGGKVKQQAQQFLKQKWVDFIGSDLHRPSDLRSLETLFSSPDYKLLQQQPLRNQDL
jgi:tyrosine-protein phosphatase YwqE